MALSTTQYGYIIDPMVPFTDGKGKTIKDGFVRVFVAGSSTPVITYRNFDGAANQDLIELDNSGRTKTSVIGSKGLTYKVCVYDKDHSKESPILTVDKVSVIGANITAGAGATVVTGLDGLTTKPDGFVNASVVGTDGYVALDHTLVTDDLDTDAKVTAVEEDRYVPLLNEDVNDLDSKMTLGRLWQWVLGKIKNLTTTATEADLVSSNYLPLDGSEGLKKLPGNCVTSKKEFIGVLKEISKSEVYQTRCYYNNSGSLTVSAQISSNVFDADEVYYIETVALASGVAPAILWYNSDELTSGNLISVEYGTETLAENRVLFAGNVTPPAGAVKCVVNCYNDYIGYCHVINKLNKLTKMSPASAKYFNKFTNLKDGAAYVTGGAVVEDNSNQFKHTRIDVDDVEEITTICQNGTNNRSILCFKGTDSSFANYLQAIEPVDALDSVHTTLGKITLKKDRLPKGTTHVIVNVSTQVTLPEDIGYYTTKKHNVVKTTLRDNLRGLITYDGNDVEITDNFNWSYNVIPVERLGTVHTYSGGRSDIFPILYFDSEELTTAHYVGSVAGDASLRIIDITDYAVPASAKYAVITSNRNHSEEVYFNLDRLDIGDYAEVGDGKDFSTITSAIDSLPDDFEIRLDDGVYEENVSVWKGSVFLKGSSPENCKIVSSSGLYVDTTVEMICGRLENITVAAEYENGVSHEVVDENGAYALHIEQHAMAVDFAVGKKLELINCVFVSDFAPGVGCGALSGWKLICKDCRFITRQVTGRGNYYAQGGLGGFYMHDQNSSAYTTKAKLEMVDCSCESESLANAMAITDNDLQDGRGVDATFQRVILSSPTGHDNNIWWRGESGFTGCWSNSYTSSMNSDSQLDG